jgi:hypothetical protein
MAAGRPEKDWQRAHRLAEEYFPRERCVRVKFILAFTETKPLYPRFYL